MALCGMMGVSGNDKSMSETVKTLFGTVDDPVSSGTLHPVRHTRKQIIRLAKKVEYTMFSIAIVVLIIVFPVLIPAAVSSVRAIADARQRRRDRITNPLGCMSDLLVGS